jgi:hypothetical protein
VNTWPKRRKVNEEKGIEVIEFIGTAPLILIVGMIVWQFMVFAHCAVVTHSAAREGARRAATYEDWGQAVESTMGGFEYRVQPGGCGGKGDMVRFTVVSRLPIFNIPLVPIPDIEIKATGVSWCEEP